MAIIANALGMKTPVAGMLGPQASHVTEVTELYDFDALWQGDKTPVVDYILGAEPGGGVFVVAYNDHPYQRQMLDYYKLGKGPYYVIYRHCHLCHIEAMRTIADIAIAGVPLLQPWQGLRKERSQSGRATRRSRRTHMLRPHRKLRPGDAE
jgi:predicted homoserine dehydrogenase-like protein